MYREYRTWQQCYSESADFYISLFYYEHYGLASVYESGSPLKLSPPIPTDLFNSVGTAIIARARTALRLDYREDCSQAYEDLGMRYSLTW